MNAREQNEEADFRGSETPTPPAGLPIGDAPTPPIGIEGLSAAVSAEDFGKPGPTVLGGEPAGEAERGEAGDWPALEYRSRNKPESGSGALGWLRRRRE